MPNQLNPDSYYTSVRTRDAIRKLRKYFPGKTSESELEKAFNPQSLPSSQTSSGDQLGKLVSQVLLEGLTGDQISKKVNDFFKGTNDDKLKKRFIEAFDIFIEDKSKGITSDDKLYKTLSTKDIAPRNVKLPPSTSGSPEKTDDADVPDNTLTIINVKDSRVTPSDRDSAAVDLFMNSLPTHELSRCVPFFDMRLLIGGAPYDEDERLFGLSLPRFILGAQSLKEGYSATKSMLSGDKTEGESGGEKFPVTTSGMEIFTAPQTLVPLTTQKTQGDTLIRPTAVLDKFRPLISVESFRVSVVPQNGPLSYKSAELSLLLHDRSRLHEVAELVRPDNYGTNEILIEYGWSHPDTSGNNAFGDIINSMRVKEKYGVFNSRFSFKPNGSVSISLQLYLKGPQDCYTTEIAEHGAVSDSAKAIERIISKANEILERKNTVLQNQTKGRKELKPSKVMQAALDFESLVNASPRVMRAISKRGSGKISVKRLTVKEDKARLEKALRELVTLQKKFNADVRTVVNKKMKMMDTTFTSKNEGLQDADPFDAPPPNRTKRRKRRKRNRKAPNNFISFGKLMSIMVGRPLLSTGKFDEVQLIFYPFNKQSNLYVPHGAPANDPDRRMMTTAEFYINKNEIKENVENLMKQERTTSISLIKFVNYIVSTHVEFMGSMPYGLGLTPSQRKQMRENPTVPEYRKTKSLKARIAKAEGSEKKRLQKKLRKLQHGNAKQFRQRQINKKLEKLSAFVMPKVRAVFECVPTVPVEQGQSASSTEGGTILKVHFFDEHTGNKEIIQELLDSTQANALQNIQSSIADSRGNANEIIQNLTSEGAQDKYGLKLRRTNPGAPAPEARYELVGGYDRLRKFIVDHFSTIVYGSSNTAVKNASVTSMNDSKLNTVHLRRAGSDPNRTVAGQDSGGLPLRIQPTELSMTTIGCPLLQFGQSFFVDFKTATTADDVYSIVNLQHEITPGKFETQMKMVPRQVYGRYQGLFQVINQAIDKLTDE